MHGRISINALSLGIPSLGEMEDLCAEIGPRRISFVTGQIEAEGEEAALKLLHRCRYDLETISHPFQLGALSPE